MKLATFFLVAAPLLSPHPAFGRLIGDQNRRLRTEEICTVADDCAQADACSIASCVASVCEYKDPCAGFTTPDANGNCGKASCNINGATYECAVPEPVTTGCREGECDPCTGGCNTDTGCCDARNPCDGIPCNTGICIPDANGLDFTCPKKVCEDNADNDCILDECKDTGGGTPEDGECRTFNVLLGQPCTTTEGSGTCDGLGNCTTTTTTTIPPPPATEAPPEAATEAPPEAATEAPPEAATEAPPEATTEATPTTTSTTTTTCGIKGGSCTDPSNCCSKKCKGPSGNKECK